MKSRIANLLFAMSVTLGLAQGATKPNILFIAVDDLRPDLGCYGVSHIYSPNIDRLANQGVKFEHAYVNVAVCNPSRASMMTGMMPDTLRCWDLNVHFRESAPHVTTLPQHFRKFGYHAVGYGKIYHNPTPDPQSWSEPVKNPVGLAETYSKELLQEKERLRAKLPDDFWGKSTLRGHASHPCLTNDDSKTHDGATTDMAIATIKRLAKREQPFFVAQGYVRPHLPFIPPKKYWDLYDREKLPLAENRSMPRDGAPMAIGTNYELRHYCDFTDMPAPNEATLSDERARQLIHGYCASISFVDAQIGRLLQGLEEAGVADNTIVVFWSDHGWKLGEHNGWSKMTNHEIDTRIPFIVYDPRAKGNGKATKALIESVDIYPTLCDLAGIPLHPQAEGKSFKTVLDEPDGDFRDFVRSQYIHHHGGKTYMGYAIRDTRYRYVEWRNVASGKLGFQEIFDQIHDPQENINIFETIEPANKTALVNTMQAEFPRRKLDISPQLQSGNSKIEVKISIQNTHESAVNIYAISKRGSRVFYKKLAPGASVQGKAMLGDYFIAEAVDGRVHRILAAGYPTSDFTISSN